MALEEIREKIDSIDSQLLELLNQRASHALEIGHKKRAMNKPIYDESREKKILEKITSHNKGPLSNSSIEKIFKLLIAETRNLEEEKSKPQH